MKRSFSVFTIFILMLSTLPLLAAGPGTDSPLIPYHGYLESDGIPAMGPYDFYIELLDGDNMGADAFWIDEFKNIPVVAGEFSLILGSESVFSRDSFFTDNIQLKISLRPAASGDFVALNGTQRLLQVPFSARTEGRIKGDLYVEAPSGVFEFAGTDLKLWGTGRCGELSDEDCRAENRRALVHGTGDKLILNYDGDYKHGVEIHSTVKITNNLEVSGTAKINDKPIPVGEESLRIVRGIIQGDGTIRAGAGFSVNHTGIGFYNINFVPDFVSIPTMTVTQWYESDDHLHFGDVGGDTRDNCSIVYLDRTAARIKCGDNTGSANNRWFHFIAIGP